MAVDLLRLRRARRWRPFATPAHRLLRLGFGLWIAWRRRRELRRLAEFDDRLLRDIGLRRGDVERALASPFWRDLDPERRARGSRPRS